MIAKSKEFIIPETLNGKEIRGGGYALNLNNDKIQPRSATSQPIIPVQESMGTGGGWPIHAAMLPFPFGKKTDEGSLLGKEERLASFLLPA